MNLVYCRTNDQVVHIFIKPLLNTKFVKLQAMLGLQEVAIMMRGL